MCGPAAAIGAAGLVMSFMGSRKAEKAAKKAAAAERALAETNAAWDDQRAEQALAIGYRDEEYQLGEGRRLIGSQRVAVADANVELSGSALAVVAEDAGRVATDAAQIRANAMQEAWGYKVNAYNQRVSGQRSVANAQAYARAQRYQTYGNILTTGAQIYQSYASSQKPAAGTGG